MKLWPTRSENLPVRDLDAIVAEPVPFRFKGKIHHLKPFSVAEYFKFVNAQAALLALSNEDKSVDAETLAKGFFGVISAVCDTVTLEDIRSSQQVQIAALYQMIIDQVTGQVDFGEGKKKVRSRVNLYAIARGS